MATESFSFTRKSTATWSPSGPIDSWQYATYRKPDGSLVTMPVDVVGAQITYSRGPAQ